MSETTAVVFRTWTPKAASDPRGVVALFPQENASLDEWWLCSSYEHVGQHAAADYAGVLRESRPATEAEYAPLKRELEGQGYVLKVYKRAPNMSADKRRTVIDNYWNRRQAKTIKAQEDAKIDPSEEERLARWQGMVASVKGSSQGT